jgi:hypothetical protein
MLLGRVGPMAGARGREARPGQSGTRPGSRCTLLGRVGPTAGVCGQVGRDWDRVWRGR